VSPTVVGRRIDLNADVGEGYRDDELLALVTSANVACGAHAGDAATMRATVRLARALGVRVGAHPGFADRAGFGRRIGSRDPAVIADLVAAQIAALARIAAEEGVTLAHVKPHGALYNLAAIDDEVADAVAATVARCAPGAHLMGLAGSRALHAARRHGVIAEAEGFADRGYLGDGTLAPRERAGALLDAPADAARQAVRLACDGAVTTLDGATLTLQVDTLCLHGDAPDAAARARAVRVALLDASVRLSPPD
jgi:UPF0271 protein